MKLDWTAGVHHDGSEVYVSNPYPTFNEVVEIRLRVPKESPIEKIYLRSQPDGEQHDDAMVCYAEATHACWYRTTLTLRNSPMAYSFKIETTHEVWFYNAQGMSRIESIDAFNFKLLADFQYPTWINNAVFYQIFPDRFHNADAELNPVGGQEIIDSHGRAFETRLLDWEMDAPLLWKDGGSLDFFGGDLLGIQQKLDYLKMLGVNALYLNPIFTSRSNHKYNISDFYNVDPHFGGNSALAELSDALHTEGFSLLLDVTPNHCGSDHPWFVEAQHDPHAPTADYFTFYEHPHQYECWNGVKSLPKLNYRSQALCDAMYRREDSVLKYWLQAPFKADGWRLDVWNMTARQGQQNYWHAVGQEIREEVKALNPEAYLLGESFFDGSPSLQGDELDATMNYRGFSMPLWRWLSGHDHVKQSVKKRLPSEVAAQQMQHYIAAIPWAIARMQFNQLGSHDTPRILALIDNNKRLAKVAATLLLTFPGVPCIYYGDEVGLAGDHRHPMPWNKARWDKEMLEHYQAMIALRHSSDALKNGGFEFVYCQGDVLVYKRQSHAECLLIVGYRGEENAANLEIPMAHVGLGDGTELVDVITQSTYRIEHGVLSIPAQTQILKVY